MTRNRTCPRFYGCPHYLQVISYENEVAILRTTFSALQVYKEFSVGMETRVLILSAPKPIAAFSQLKWCYMQNLNRSGRLASEIFKFESVDDGRWWQRTDGGPLLYLWAFGSGELKIEGTSDWKISNMGFFGIHGQVAPKSIVLSGLNSKSLMYVFLCSA